MAQRPDSYNGNKNLKREAVSIEWSQEMLEEYKRCAEDPIYFIKKYIRIVSVDHGLIPFKLWGFQEEMVKKCVDNRFVICKMPRQVGKTTTIAALLVWYMLFNENFSIAILANKEKQAREILARVQLAYEYLPKWLQQGIKEWNKSSAELENGSKIIASSTSSSAIRGTSQNLIYLDEFAFVPNNMQEQFFASVYPTISSGKTSKVMITSTPNGMNTFYKIWCDSEEGRNSYIRHDVHWSDVPGRDEKWRLETIANTSEEQFRVEFECEFVGSSNTLISGQALRRLVYFTPIDKTPHLKVYKEPDPRRAYAMSVDTARGDNNDYSAFTVIDITEVPYQVVAVYRNNAVSPLIFPTSIYEIGKRYNEAIALIETNDLGQQVADILYRDLEYDNVIMTAPSGKQGIKISGGHGKDVKIGVRTTKVTKRIGCAHLKTLIESTKLLVNDYDIISELSRFSLKGTSYQAEEGNDDLAMCLVMFSWFQSQPYFKEVCNIDIRENLMIENLKMIEADLTPFGIIDDGHDAHIDHTRVNELPYNTAFDDWFRDKPADF